MKIAILGDHDQNRPSHIATARCLQKHSRVLDQEVEIEWLPTFTLEKEATLARLQDFSGVWGAPGEHVSQLGMINGIQFARENDIPYLGT